LWGADGFLAVAGKFDEMPSHHLHSVGRMMANLKRLSTAETPGGFCRVEAPYSNPMELTLTELAEVYPTNASKVTA
jgi:hypothetical protein